MLLFTGFSANGNFTATYKVLLRKRGLLTETSDFLKNILEFHTQDIHSWLIIYNKQKERNERE